MGCRQPLIADHVGGTWSEWQFDGPMIVCLMVWRESDASRTESSSFCELRYKRDVMLASQTILASVLGHVAAKSL